MAWSGSGRRPRRSPATAVSRVPCAVIMMTGRDGSSSSDTRKSARPSTSGIRKSVTSASKRSVLQPMHGLTARAGRDRREPLLGEGVGDHLGHFGAIVDHEDPRCVAASQA